MKVRLRNPEREVEVAGGRRVRELLAELSIDPDTVLVIRDRTLLTRDDHLEDDDRVEVRPVISGGSGEPRATAAPGRPARRRGSGPRCRRCRRPGVIELPRHNASFCEPCFLRYVHEQVRRAVDQFDMFGAQDRILVAVSGGKDSLALWDVLLEQGYRATGLYLGLGIGEYSERSGEAVDAFARERRSTAIRVDLRDAYGFDIPTAGAKGSRSTCSVCGLSKRYAINRAALDHGFDVVATGHNLDDEAATLLGNTLRWQTDYIARQHPALPEREGMVRKVKPLYRVAERETAAYAVLRGIDYVVEECPLVAGNTQLKYKDAMNHLEAGSPGTKASFYLGYLDRAAGLFRAGAEPELTGCERCGQPTTGRFCAFCRARAQVLGERLGSPAGRSPDRGAPDEQIAGELSGEVLPAEIYGGPGGGAGEDPPGPGGGP